MNKRKYNNLSKKRQAQWDSLAMIFNRCVDVLIMFLSVFTLIYLCNGNYITALILGVLDLIIIPSNNGKQIFDFIHKHISKWHQYNKKIN